MLVVFTSPATIYVKRDVGYKMKAEKDLPEKNIWVETAGSIPKGTVADVEASGVYGYLSANDNNIRMFRLNKGIPGKADAGEFLERTNVNHKEVQPEGLAKPQEAYFDSKKSVYKESDSASKVIGSLKPNTKYTVQKVYGKDSWYYLPSKRGYVFAVVNVAFAEEKKEPPTTTAAKAPAAKPPAAKAPPSSFGLAPPSSPTPLSFPVAAPAQAGMSTTTMIAIGLIAVSAIILLLPKRK